jgi:P-type conjugative transfer protein TrbJ
VSHNIALDTLLSQKGKSQIMNRTRRIIALLSAIALWATQLSAADAQVLGPVPVYDLAAHTTQLLQYTNMINQLTQAVQMVTTTEAAYNQATREFTGINPANWQQLEAKFRTVLNVPAYIQQTAGQTSANLAAFENRFPNYVPNQNYAQYQVMLANNTKSANQNTLQQAATYNSDFHNTELYTNGLLSAPPATQEQALHTMSILLQQNIEQVGKLGNMLSAQSSNMALYYGQQSQRQVMANTLDCESQVKTVLNSARELDAGITEAQVRAVLLQNSPNCARQPNALQ